MSNDDLVAEIVLVRNALTAYVGVQVVRYEIRRNSSRDIRNRPAISDNWRRSQEILFQLASYMGPE